MDSPLPIGTRVRIIEASNWSAAMIGCTGTISPTPQTLLDYSARFGDGQGRPWIKWFVLDPDQAGPWRSDMFVHVEDVETIEDPQPKLQRAAAISPKPEQLSLF